MTFHSSPSLTFFFDTKHIVASNEDLDSSSSRSNRNDQEEKKFCLENYSRDRPWSDDLNVSTSKLWLPDTWQLIFPVVILRITLRTLSSMSRPILQQYLWSIQTSCTSSASCLLSLSLSSYPLKTFWTFWGLHQSDYLSWSNFSVSIINVLFSTYNLSTTSQKINWNTHV